jgi:AcrR family transcriptional regulator
MSPAPMPTKGEATKQRILVCAVVRFAGEGFRGTSVAQIARDAEVTAPTVHAHFGSKEDLFQAAFAHDIEALLEMFRDRIAGGLSMSAPAGLIPELLAEFGSHPLARRVFQGREADRTRDLLKLPAVVRARADLIALVEGGQHAGLLRADLSSVALAGALETIVLALLLGGVQIGMIGGEDRRLAILAVISAGLRAPESESNSG